MTKIQLRHDTSTRWQTANPILAPGEVGVETDTQKIKVGNGSTAYNSLQYIGTTRVTNETNLNNIIEPGTYYFSGTRWSNLTNKPFNDSSHTVAWMIVISYNSGNTAQIVFSGKGDFSDCDFAIRYRISSGWNSWHYVRPTSVLSYNVPNGLVVLDSSGRLPAVDGSQLTNLPSSTPSNMVTTDTAQTITGAKTFNEPVTIEGSSISSEADLTIQKPTASAAVIKFGERGATIKGDSSDICYLRETVIQTVVPIQAAYALDADKPYYLNQNSITAGSDNLVISKTDTGIQITCNTPTGTLKYWTGTEAEYTAISTKDPDTLYRTTDTNKVFLGTIQLGG